MKAKKINLLHLKTSANIGGAESMLIYWARFLDRNKFNQFVIFAEEGILVKNIEELGVKVKCLPTLNSMMGITQVHKLIRFIRKNNIDIIHAHGARVNLWGTIASLLTVVPIISTEHNIDLWRSNNYFFNLIDKLSAKINSVRVGVSPAVCDMLKNQGMRLDKIVCIENGIDIDQFCISVDVSAKKSEIGIPTGNKIIGTIGRLVEQKGHRYLIEAAKMLVSKYPKVNFLIVGDGHLRDALEKQAKNLGLNKKITFAGQRKDIPALLAIMDIFVLPSITEGLPLVLLEAMASGKPIISSAVSGIPYVIRDKIEGLLVQPKNADMLKDKILFLIENPDKARTLSFRAKEAVTKKHNARNMISRYESIYENIL